MDFELNEWLEYAERVAKQFAKTYWPKPANRNGNAGDGLDDRWEDIYQELAIELITKEDKLVEAFLKMESPSGYVKTILKNCAFNYCVREKNKDRKETDLYEYQTADVRIMVEQYLSGTKRKILVPEDARTIFGEDDLAILCDIGRVVDDLSETDYDTLETYLFESGTKDTAERQRYSRVIKKVTNTLNYNKKKASKDYVGTGKRKAMSNLKAAAVTKNTNEMREGVNA